MLGDKDTLGKVLCSSDGEDVGNTLCVGFKLG
jgi:hypothetical protein